MEPKKIFKVAGGLLLSLVVVALAVYGYASHKYQQALETKFNAPAFTIKDEVATADVELGKRIVNVRNGCIHCHGANLAGAVAVDDPAIGRFVGANLTPYALKNWTDEQIATAIRYGVKPDGSTLQFMPSFEYQAMSKSDLAAVVAYLRTVPAVETPAPKQQVGPLAKVLFVAGKIPVLVSAMSVKFDAQFDSKPAEGPTPEFGKYLATGSCVGCHGAGFQGGPIPGGPPSWAPASDLRFGANKAWTEEKFVQAMRSGVSPLTGKPLREPMPVELVKQMSDVELKALWLYLSSLN